MYHNSSSDRKRKSSEKFDTGNKRSKPVSTVNERRTKPVKTTLKLTDLPEVPLLKIASFFNGKDLLNFSHLNRQLFHVCNSSSFLWKNVLKMDGLTFSKIIRENAAKKSGKFWKSDPTTNVDKVSYFLHVRTKRNWKSGKIARTMTLPALQGHPGD